MKISQSDLILLKRRWFAFIKRCTDPTCRDFANYGGRGIEVCETWLNSFDAFCGWAIETGFTPDKQIDRRDNNAGYSPQNCHWVSQTENSRNRRNTQFITAFGETKARMAWAEDARCKVQYVTLANRIRKGWEPERALTEPQNESILRLVTAFGETKHLREWARDPRCVVTYKTLHKRIVSNYDPEMAMTTPQMTSQIQQAHGKGQSARIEAFGEVKSIEDWARDSRCTVKACGLWVRLNKHGLDPETAITRKNKKQK